MDPVNNPFVPGAGSPPPELAGRDEIISNAEVSIKRVMAGRHAKSQIFLGLRGTGKTVLLNKIKQVAESNQCLTSFIESPEDEMLASLLYPQIHQVLRHLSTVHNAKAHAHEAMRALKNFASIFKVSVGDVTISVDAKPGTADSGNLEFDLSDLFLKVGQAAQSAKTAWCLLVDELQYLSKKELAALIVALHRVNQESLPVLFFGSGLPQVASMAGDAKSYAERLFDFPPIGSLDKAAAVKAIRQPIESEGASISDAALERILHRTEGYPYFLQEWGFQAWNIAESSPISREDVDRASVEALRRLDEGFFRVRYDRLTPKEREYVIAMASLERRPYRSSDIADKLGENVNTLGPQRARIIAKGVIYSPRYGDVEFSVPMFEEFVKRVEGSD
ncbi:MAG: ATP-binding protein [Candidatus Dadabacteria bacterium]|nr:ATP-binding protein [Candidatus Dadabacteria bacterium]